MGKWGIPPNKRIKFQLVLATGSSRRIVFLTPSSETVTSKQKNKTFTLINLVIPNNIL